VPEPSHGRPWPARRPDELLRTGQALPGLGVVRRRRRCRVRSINSSFDLISLIPVPIMLHMSKEWQVLSKLGAGSPVEILRARLVEQDVVVEGPFELPPLARLSREDQTFVAAFVRCHGSIQQ